MNAWTRILSILFFGAALLHQLARLLVDIGVRLGVHRPDPAMAHRASPWISVPVLAAVLVYLLWFERSGAGRVRDDDEPPGFLDDSDGPPLAQRLRGAILLVVGVVGTAVAFSLRGVGAEAGLLGILGVLWPGTLAIAGLGAWWLFVGSRD